MPAQHAQGPMTYDPEYTPHSVPSPSPALAPAPLPAAPGGEGISVPGPDSEAFFAPPKTRAAGATLGDRVSHFFRRPRSSTSDRGSMTGLNQADIAASQTRTAGVTNRSTVRSSRVTTGRHPDAWADLPADQPVGQPAEAPEEFAGLSGGHTPPNPDWSEADLVPAEDQEPIAPEESEAAWPAEETGTTEQGLDLTPDLESRRNKSRLLVPTSRESRPGEPSGVQAVPLWKATSHSVSPASLPGLRIVRLTLAEEVDERGATVPLANAVLRRGEAALVVAALDNVTARTTSQGLESETATEIELRAWNGIVLSRQSLGSALDVSQRPRENYFVVHELAVPGDLAPGKYIVTLRVTDVTSQSVAEARTELTVGE